MNIDIILNNNKYKNFLNNNNNDNNDNNDNNQYYTLYKEI